MAFLRSCNHWVWHWVWLSLCLIVETILAIVYWLRVMQGQPLPWLDFNGQFTLPSLLQALAMLILANLALYQHWKYRYNRSPPPPSRLFLITLTLFLYFAAADELFKIHLLLESPRTRHEIVQFYIGVIYLIPVIFGRDIWRIWRQNCQAAILGLTGLIIFFIGGFCSITLRDMLLSLAELERLKIPWIQAVLQFSMQHDPQFEITRIAIEELLELWGETIVVFGAWYLLRSLPPPCLKSLR